MHFRFLATLATAFLAGTSVVLGAPAPASDSTDLVIDRRQLSSITSILEVAVTALAPVLSVIEGFGASSDGSTIQGALTSVTTILTGVVSALEAIAISGLGAVTGLASITDILAILGPLLAAIAGILATATGLVSTAPVLGSVVSPAVSTISSLTSNMLLLMTQEAPGIATSLGPMLSGDGLSSILPGLNL
ncbi:hypothetical protein HYPSUDRAFT_204723 [Hypholoma sublateritium FD-334 SS-4]|uniref:Uncharacterized protein n=1 Tax=Hypholoma sublateritium (strain FD-334 SS-4) TaxID=945553 RepID=A0A0D2KXS8_HYPSF|nr:hypothetical protein HYPSUDRAFT_204723 [Hypholoma sublateritium FD-334 SS-4]